MKIEIKFTKGQKVRHEQDKQEMFVDDFQMEAPTKMTYNILAGHKSITTGPKEFTGQVWCVWLVNGEEKGSYFDQDRLVLI